MDIAGNFQRMLNGIPSMRAVLDRINSEGLRYGLIAGSYVSIMTRNRPAADADFILGDGDLAVFGGLFPSTTIKEVAGGIFLYPIEDHNIEFMTRNTIRIGGSAYKYRLTDLAWEHTSVLAGPDWSVQLCDPVETILLKAILQRGPEEGKHDSEDVQALAQATTIDENYLDRRLVEINADERVLRFLHRFDLAKGAIPIGIRRTT